MALQAVDNRPVSLAPLLGPAVGPAMGRLSECCYWLVRQQPRPFLSFAFRRSPFLTGLLAKEPQTKQACRLCVFGMLCRNSKEKGGIGRSVLLMAAVPDSGRLVGSGVSEPAFSYSDQSQPRWSCMETRLGSLWVLKGSVLKGGFSGCFSSYKNVLGIVVTRLGCCKMLGVPAKPLKHLDSNSCVLHSLQRNVLLMCSGHLEEDPPRSLIYSRSPFALPPLDQLEDPQLLRALVTFWEGGRQTHLTLSFCFFSVLLNLVLCGIYSFICLPDSGWANN